MRNPIGDTRVAILIPSRLGDGTPIDPALRLKVITHVQESLSRRFGGASVESIQGSYAHSDGSRRVTHEPIDRVYAAVSRPTLTDGAAQSEVDALAQHVAEVLDQECVLEEWGPECIFVNQRSDARKKAHREFAALPEDLQEQFVRAACGRIECARDFGSLLSLDGWKVEPAPEAHPDRLLASKGKRRALLSKEGPSRGQLKSGDLAFADDAMGGGVLVWAHTGDQVCGPRRFPTARPQTARLAVELGLAMLGSRTVEPLAAILDREVATADFYRRYERLHARVVEEMKRAGHRGGSEHSDAQLLLGRLMFLRFIEQRGWLNNDRAYLQHLFEAKGRRRFVTALDELFRLLDTPLAERAPGSAEGTPFLNGGLFDRSRTTPSLPDRLFDPREDASVLGLFARYDFTLDESTTADVAVAVDPSMFGLVLESLKAQEDRKREGVFYTPRPIARALAYESIVSRLADVTHIPRSRLSAFVRGDNDAINDPEAESISKKLDELRIVDPAVGSGSLLLAALDVLMDIVRRCFERDDVELKRGSRAWSRRVRYFAKRCLYGVDLDAEAVEVARLRLWLAIAVGDEVPVALPDLGHNLAVGDSLASRGFDARMLQAGLWNPQGALFGASDAATQRYAEALSRYYSSDTLNILAAREAAGQLEEAERALLACIDDEARGMPFAWTVHFGDVFARENAGFDVVIANPPYVRAERLDRERYQRLYPSLYGNTDLYLAFVERGLDLAGKKGKLAYIVPNFGDKQAGRQLRRILGQRGALDRMVSFGDQQVFASATNYVALVFATGEKRKRKEFNGGRVAHDTEWLDTASCGVIEYEDEPWYLLAPDEIRWLRERAKRSVPLGELCSIEVGVQTSADDVFLFESKTRRSSGIVSVRSEYLGSDVELEDEALRRCAKGSRDLKPNKLVHERWILWPYGGRNEVLDETAIAKSFPMAWDYLLRCRKRLEHERDANVKDGKWWRFGRKQGIAVSTTPKIIVPSLMKEATAVLDSNGSVAITASGKGGGGAYALRLLAQSSPRPAVSVDRLVEVLNSTETTRWIQLVGDMKRDGYRGVDRSLLATLPVPLSTRTTSATRRRRSAAKTS